MGCLRVRQQAVARVKERERSEEGTKEDPDGDA